MLISDCSAVIALLTMTALAVYRSPAKPYADSEPHSELMMTNGMPARARARDNNVSRVGHALLAPLWRRPAASLSQRSALARLCQNALRRRRAPQPRWMICNTLPRNHDLLRRLIALV